jgi:hypothetical protein
MKALAEENQGKNKTRLRKKISVFFVFHFLVAVDRSPNVEKFGD